MIYLTPNMKNKKRKLVIRSTNNMKTENASIINKLQENNNQTKKIKEN